jgi:hypothetical protein
MPSVGDVLFIAMVGLLSCTPLSVRLLGDAGIGWHIRTGQHILATHAIPRVDLFSSTMQGAPWFAWEWLYDLGVGTLERAAGLNGVVLFTALIIAGVFAWTFRLLVRRGTSVLVAAALVVLAASASMIHFLTRPHVLSWLFTVSWFAILDWSEKRLLCEEERGSARLLWLLPALMLLWVNVHGGWLIGFGLLAVYWVSALRTWLWTGEDRLESVLLRLRAAHRARELAWVSIAAVAATLVNPYGWNLHRHIYHYLSNRFLMDHIDEFQSPNFHGVAQRCFAALMLIAFVALASKARRVRLSEGLIVLFAVYAGLVASRNIPVSSFLLAIVIGPLLTEAMQRVKWRQPWGRQRLYLHSAGQPGRVSPTFSQRMSAVELSLRGHIWPVALVVLSCWIAIHEGWLGSKQLMSAHFEGKRFPVAAVDLLERSGSPEPVLSPDYWGGYLIFRLHPKVLVVADDRHDLYGEEFFKSYLKMIRLETGWATFIREHRVRRILMPRESALANILAETPAWHAVYSDDVAVLYELE